MNKCAPMLRQADAAFSPLVFSYQQSMCQHMRQTLTRIQVSKACVSTCCNDSPYLKTDWCLAAIRPSIKAQMLQNFLQHGFDPPHPLSTGNCIYCFFMCLLLSLQRTFLNLLEQRSLFLQLAYTLVATSLAKNLEACGAGTASLSGSAFHTTNFASVTPSVVRAHFSGVST